MFVKIYPSEVSSFVLAQPSVISSHCAILTAALSEGITKIDNVVYSGDVKYTLSAIEKIGAGYMVSDEALFVSGIGQDKVYSEEKIVIDCGCVEELFKLILPVAVHFYAQVEFILRGSLRNASFDVFEDVFRRRGLVFEHTKDGILVGGRIGGGEFNLSESDDWISICGILLVSVLSDEYTEIEISSAAFVRRHIEDFIACQRLLGIAISMTSDTLLDADGGQIYENEDITVEKDIIPASYFMIAGAFGAGIDIVGIEENDMDEIGKAVMEIFHKAELRTEYTDHGIRVRSGRPCRFSVDLSDYPELIAVTCLLAIFSPGFSVIKVSGELPEKIKDLIYELRSADVRIGFSDGQIVIEGTHIQKYGVFSSHDDPELAMFFGVYSLLSEGSCIIEGAQCIERVYPDFWHDLRCTGVRVDEGENGIL